MIFRSFLTCLILSLACGGVLHAEWRDFQSADGQTIRAELVSYRGTKVRLKREDGREFEVEANIFSLDDQIYIKAWMGQTAENIDYNFRIEVDAKKDDTEIENQTGYRYKTDTWHYEFTILNLSRDVMKGLTFQYRIVYEDEVTESFGILTPTDEVLDGEYAQKEEMPFNHKVEFQTESFVVQELDYGTTDYDDELKGVLLRILDESGNVAVDWVMPISTMKGYTWENTQEPPAQN